MIPVAHISPLLRQLAANIAGGAAWNSASFPARFPRAIPVPSMKKSLVFLGLAVAAALVAVLAWSLRGGRAHEFEHGDAAHDDTLARVELDSGVEVETADTARRERLETAAPVTDGPTLVVVERDSGRALAGADVIWESGSETLAQVKAKLEAKVNRFFDAQSRSTGERADESRPITLLSGRRFTTDTSGRVRVPASDDTALIVAHHGVLTGSTEIAANERGIVRVELVSTDDLVVRVLTANGDPAPGVSVFVGLGLEGDTVGGSALTDVSGRARLVHLTKNLSSANAELALVVRADVPLVATIGKELSAADITAQLVELRLPPTGSVSVRVRMADGSAPKRGATVSIAAADPAQLAASAASAAPRAIGQTALVVDGIARFERVGLARTWRARHGTGGLEGGLAQEFTGPRTAGETVAIELDYGRQPLVAWKLIDGDGTPYAQRQIAGGLSQGGTSDTGTLTSDAQGRVRLALSTNAADIARRTLTLSFEDREKVELDLSREFPAGVTELPDIQLREKPLLASGRVLGAHDVPVAGANVRVERRMVDARDGDVELWQTAREFSATSRFDGTFVVYGEAHDANLGLRASTSNGRVAAERVEFTPGQRGIDLRVVSPGGISARVRAPAELELGRLSARLALTGAPAATSDASSRQRVEVGADGKLLAGGLMPGRWELVIGSSLTSELARVDGIVVTAGETTDAGVIDLTARIARVRLEIVDEAGTRLPQASVRCLSQTLQSKQSAHVEPGVFEYWFPAEGCDVNVECDGHRGVTLSRVRADQRVVLQSGVQVRVRALGTARLASDEFKLGVQFEFDGADAQGASPRGRMFGGTFDAGREFAAVAPFDGPYRAWWTVETQRGTGWAVRAVSLASTERFVIERGKSGAVIELFVPPGLLDDAAQSVKERDESGKTNTAPAKIEPPRRG